MFWLIHKAGSWLASTCQWTITKVKVKVKLLSCVQLFATPWTVTWLLCPWDFPGNSTGVDCHFLLQGIFPTQGLNPGLAHCRQTLYHLSHQGSPGIKEKKKKKALEHLNCKLHFKAKTVISTTSKATLAYNHTWIFCQVSIDSASNSTLFKSKMHKNKKYTVALLFLL